MYTIFLVYLDLPNEIVSFRPKIYKKYLLKRILSIRNRRRHRVKISLNSSEKDYNINIVKLKLIKGAWRVYELLLTICFRSLRVPLKAMFQNSTSSVSHGWKIKTKILFLSDWKFGKTNTKLTTGWKCSFELVFKLAPSVVRQGH